MDEINSCNGPSGLDPNRLVAQPLLQSCYAETLRLRVTNGMVRQNDSEPFVMGNGYRVPKGEPMVIFTHHPSLNEESWNSTRSSSTDVPLTQFHAERFLVPDDTVEENTSNGNVPGADVEGGKYKFSLDGLAGLWLPYGGGQRMCPGRHFAKAEMLSTLSLLLSQFDLELMDTDKFQPKPDSNWFPTGALPPDCKVPFRMRRRAKATYDIDG
ncbi:hypothetical protein PFICI_14804 [Pestalotiopsis fici W106-1]|uniref:Cytochrome P450 n=1 Tax=Pestalotiopsis fici (strain W106-1 / CGMCC3.15140) TaxID=1229662 RepID=W3WJ01_PESFW|nr:uncharacterized protein PFICI_14804 [Pestalotiopsis fici W106-1]ETS73858.1 hypothetical protein PFICI_14804 [Pestalotiopsis fici W106-1]